MYKHRHLLFITSTAVFDLSLCLVMEQNTEAKRKKPKQPFYDDKEIRGVV